MTSLHLLLALVIVAVRSGAQQPDDILYPVLCDPQRKSCIKSPPNCRSIHRVGADATAAEGPRCNYLATWRIVSGGIELEIGGQVDNKGGYVSLGFSPDKKAASGVALVCSKNSDSKNSKVDLRMFTYRSGSLVEKLSDPGLIVNADSVPHFDKDRSQKGGKFYTFSNRDYAVIECRAQIKLDGNTNPLLAFLQKPKDPFIYATGSLGVEPPPSGDGLEKPSWTYTTPVRKLSDLGTGGGPERSGAAKAHGCLMILAWVMCASIGTLLARYYKLQWPGRLLGKESAWFQLHRILMAICCCLTLISFIIIFIDLRGYSGLDTFPELLHPILGIIVTILTFLNPLIALCRCDPAHENRPYYNWIHWLVGTIAYVLAVLNLFIGLRLERAGNLRSIDYHIWLLIAFVLFQFVIEITLEIHTLYHWNRNKKRWQIYRQELIEYHQVAKSESAMMQPRSRPTEPLPAGRGLRFFLLALHAVVASAVACILCLVVLAY